MKITKEKSIIIGFIGTGVMGKAMAKNLMQDNHNVNVYTRTKERAMDLIDLGAIWKNSVQELVIDSDVIISMVGSPKDVKKIYFNETGILKNAKKNTLLIDMTTSKPSLAKRISETASAKNLLALDAPVSGGENAAKQATLSIMAGGTKSAYERAIPLLKAMGKKVVYMGSAGSGQFTKMCNQMAMANNVVGVCEAIILAKKSGMDPKCVIDTMYAGTSNSWVMENLAYKMIEGDFRPGFYVKHLVKDLTIALESAKELNASAPGLELCLSLFRELEGMGEGSNGTRVLVKLYENKSEQMQSVYKGISD
ncbi:oxidoreductase [Virgibacillus indicus]|uniref:Oxidoreductase n=1 Tax=Virgibacillus indicus TaxID=2024554 RepID=A0A265N5A9_9BACI|nr:NAD(P)-dependent oxidoreductase [Virgibacillus indicus]OZU87218.1 oxidoreductase [Virgibacillus indicus]